MPYLGKEVLSGFTPTVKDSFNGDNSTTAFTLSKAVDLSTDIEVFVDNIQQEPGSSKSYTVSGTTLTFNEAPPTGTENVYVVHRNSLQGSLLPPQDLGSKNYNITGNLALDKDSAVLNFGADSDINITHVADTGLTTNGNFSLKSDSSVLKFGVDSEVTLTHVHDTGLSLNDNLTITTADNDPQLTLISTDADGTVGPRINLYRNSASPADDDALAFIYAQGENDADELTDYGFIGFFADDVTDSSEDGNAYVILKKDGTNRNRINLTSTETVFNDDSVDLDFRIETDGKTHAFFVEGSSNNIAMGTTAPTFATGNGLHLGDDFHIGFGDGNGTRPDFQLGYDATNTRLSFKAGTGSDDSDIVFTTGGLLGVGIVPTGNHRQLNSSFGDDKQAFAGVGKDSTYATEVMNVFAERTANSAFSLYKAHSNDNADVEFNFRGDGNAFADGTFSGGGADYAEFFEWKDGNSSDEDRVGFTVVLDENKIVKATDSDDTSKVIGVMSARPVVLGDGDVERWKYKYLRDDYGREIWEEHTITEWTENGEKVWYETDKIPEDVTVPSDKKIITTEADGVTKLKRRKLNPSWDKSKTYVSREDRKEWGMVGLMGKLRLRKGQPTGDRWIKMRDISDTVEEWLVR